MTVTTTSFKPREGRFNHAGARIVEIASWTAVIISICRLSMKHLVSRARRFVFWAAAGSSQESFVLLRGRTPLLRQGRTSHSAEPPAPPATPDPTKGQIRFCPVLIFRIKAQTAG